MNLIISSTFMPKMSLNKKEESYLDELFKRLRSLRGDIIEFKLFGSKARGDFTKDSDIDLLLVVADKKKEIVEKKISEFVTDVLLDEGPYFSIKVYPQSKFRKLTSPPTFFIRQISNEAVDLWPKRS